MPRREPLTSRTSPQVTAVRALHTARGRAEAGLFVVEGPQGVREAIASGARIDTLFVTPDAAARWADLVEQARDRDTAVLGAVDTVVDAMAETATPQGILAVQRLRVVGPGGKGQSGAADRAGDGLGVEAAIAGVRILPGAVAAHRKRRHAGGRPVVGDAADDRQPGAAVRAVGEGVPEAAVARVVDLRAAGGAGGG